nr:PREDICTED: uncharacterized protein LOC107397558 [Tribolium castaneum]|eukprot:XP_015833635.1 PREDICTED: uncharacterized protein LOC107397558 [Tribolium castaneum]
MPNVTHLLKNIRTTLTDKNEIFVSEEIVKEYKLTNNKITIESVKAVVEEEKKVEIKIAPYLREKYLNPNHFDKMKVQGAMAILNHDTSAAIKYYISRGKISQEHSTTSWFIEIIHKWFSIMSSRYIKDGLSKRNSDEYLQTLDFLNEVIHVTNHLYVGTRGYWKPIQTGITLATQSVIDLQEKFLCYQNFHYLLLSRFTQDALENLFSTIRSRNPVPNAKEFKTALRLVSVSQYLAHTKYGNYNASDEIPLVDILNDQTHNDNDNDIDFETITSDSQFSSVVTQNLNCEEQHALYYLLGSIIKKIKVNYIYCERCFGFITVTNSAEIQNLNTLVNLKSYKEGLLIYPSREIYFVILDAEIFFRQNVRQLIAGSIKLENLMSQFLNLKNYNVPNCHFILKRVISLFFKSRIYICLKNEYTIEKPATSLKCSSKSVGMRVAVLNFS